MTDESRMDKQIEIMKRIIDVGAMAGIGSAIEVQKSLEGKTPAEQFELLNDHINSVPDTDGIEDQLIDLAERFSLKKVLNKVSEFFEQEKENMEQQILWNKATHFRCFKWFCQHYKIHVVEGENMNPLYYPMKYMACKEEGLELEDGLKECSEDPDAIICPKFIRKEEKPDGATS